MASEQSTLRSTQATNQTESQSPVKEEPGAVSILLGSLAKKAMESVTDAIDSLVTMLTDFFKFAGITNYIVVSFKVDTPAEPFAISVMVPDSDGDLDNGMYAIDVEKEIKQLMYEYLMGVKERPNITMEGHYANAAVEAILYYAKVHGYNGVLFIGNDARPKNPKEYGFEAILLKTN
jgi:hypothetical protein